VSTSGLVDTKQQPGTTKRRQYSEGLKRQMVAETQVPGASVSIVARRHDVNSNQLFRWRRQLLPKAVVASGAMVPVAIAPDGGHPVILTRPLGDCHHDRAEDSRKSGSHETLRWREMDSNFRFRRERTGFRLGLLLARGSCGPASTLKPASSRTARYRAARITGRGSHAFNRDKSPCGIRTLSFPGRYSAGYVAWGQVPRLTALSPARRPIPWSRGPIRT
jgi:hypothetical protein